MMREGLKYFTDVHLTLLAMMIFLCFFTATLIWVYRRSSTELYKQLSQLPLEDQHHEQ
jgi:cytochrome c oxidase cbb3-type subunit IV